MTQDFIEDLITACQKEGAVYFIVTSTDKMESVRFFHNLNTLPPTRTFKDGTTVTVKEDFQQFIETVDFEKPA